MSRRIQRGPVPGVPREDPSGESKQDIMNQIKSIYRNTQKQMPEIAELRAQVGPIYTSVPEIARLIHRQSYMVGISPVTYSDVIYPLELLLRSGPSDEVLNSVLQELGWGGFQGTKDDKIQILWWLYIWRRMHSNLIPERRSVLFKLTDSELREVLPGYDGPPDRASMSWAAIYGMSFQGLPIQRDVTKEPEYQNALGQPSRVVLQRAVNLHDYYGRRDNTPSFFSIYRFLAATPRTPMDTIIEEYDGNPVKVANEIGMVFPAWAVAQNRQEEYLISNLKYYGYTLTRPPGLGRPPNIAQIPTLQLAGEAMRQYTDRELIDTYEFVDTEWQTRPGLFRQLYDQARAFGATPIWTLRKKNCNNDDRFNVVTLESREKNDPDDPILSYGGFSDYRCYNVSELVNSFQKTPTGFAFNVPDFNRQKGDREEQFAVSSILQLRQLLQSDRRPLFRPLLEKIEEGLTIFGDTRRKIIELRETYKKLTPEQQEQYRDYLAWLFLLSSKMRFWPGPPVPYPQRWVEKGAQEGLCDLASRDENVGREYSFQTAFFDKVGKDMEKILTDLPRVQYIWTSGEGYIGRETIDYIIKETQNDRYCLADASDQLGQTAYFLITRVLQLDDAGFNKVIREAIPRLYLKYELPMEDAILNNNLAILDNPNAKDFRGVKRVFKKLAKKYNRKIEGILYDRASLKSAYEKLAKESLAISREPALTNNLKLLDNPNVTDYRNIKKELKQIAKKHNVKVEDIQPTRESMYSAYQSLWEALPELRKEYLDDLTQRVKRQPPLDVSSMQISGHVDPEHRLQAFGQPEARDAQVDPIVERVLREYRNVYDDPNKTYYQRLVINVSLGLSERGLAIIPYDDDTIDPYPNMNEKQTDYIMAAISVFLTSQGIPFDGDYLTRQQAHNLISRFVRAGYRLTFDTGAIPAQTVRAPPHDMLREVQYLINKHLWGMGMRLEIADYDSDLAPRDVTEHEIQQIRNAIDAYTDNDPKITKKFELLTPSELYNLAYSMDALGLSIFE